MGKQDKDFPNAPPGTAANPSSSSSSGAAQPLGAADDLSARANATGAPDGPQTTTAVTNPLNEEQTRHIERTINPGQDLGQPWVKHPAHAGADARIMTPTHDEQEPFVVTDGNFGIDGHTYGPGSIVAMFPEDAQKHIDRKTLRAVSREDGEALDQFGEQFRTARRRAREGSLQPPAQRDQQNPRRTDIGRR